MKRSKHIGIVGSIVIATMLIFTSCAEEIKTSEMRVTFIGKADKSQSVENAMMERDLTLLNAIYLDVIQCEVHYSSPAAMEGWHALPTNAGIYNLLEIDSDATVVLVHDTLMQHGDVTQYRLILGPNNTIDIDGTIYPLKVPSAEESGLKINLHDNLNFATECEIVLAFDPYHSIVEQGNGGYILKPVILVEVLNQW